MGNETGSAKYGVNYSPSPPPQHARPHSKQSKQEDIGPQALQMHQQLINMGFPEDLSLAAASKYPDDIEDAMDWLMNKQAIDKVLKDEHIDPQNQQFNAIENENIDSIVDHPHPHHNHNHNHHDDELDEAKQAQAHQASNAHFYEETHHIDHHNEDEDEYEEDEQDEQNPTDPMAKHVHTNHAAEQQQAAVPPEHVHTTDSNAISEAISTADVVMKGAFSPDVSEQSMAIIIDLMDAVLSDNSHDQHVKLEPFVRWTQSVKEIKLNSMYYEEICTHLLVEHKRVRNLYAFDRINRVFHNVQVIEANHTGWISKFYLEELLRILDNVHYLEYSKLQQIHLNDINNMGAVDKDIERYDELYRQRNWRIEKGVSNLIVSRFYAHSL